MEGNVTTTLSGVGLSLHYNQVLTKTGSGTLVTDSITSASATLGATLAVTQGTMNVNSNPGDDRLHQRRQPGQFDPERHQPGRRRRSTSTAATPTPAPTPWSP